MTMRAANIFQLAAKSLADGQISPEPSVVSLLDAIEYARADFGRPAPRHEIEMLRFAAGFEDFFHLESPFAPGLACFGGRVAHAQGSPSVSVTGRGMTLRKAFEGCVGEAIEYFSQWERDDAVATPESFDAAAATLDPVAQRELRGWVERSRGHRGAMDWMPATRLSDARNVQLPVDFCLRRPSERRSLQPPFLMGTGTAAGETLEAATLHAVLELIERDALGLWWKGGRRGCAVDAAAAEFELTIGALRRGNVTRRSRLLDITTDLGVPCVVAISCAEDGGQFAFGAAARLTLADAARTALLEVCQQELALHLVDRKARERGAAALNDADRGHLARAAAVKADACALVQPLPEPRAPEPRPLDLEAIVARASELGVEFHRVDITRRPPGVPAVRVVAPALQMEPSQTLSRRLQQTVAAYGGGDVYHQGTHLF